ncbi:MAG: hypothetical protein IBX69_14380 [Anaerolineales bacterium]|nr:hypothetical protein [Anaerolineales bacterium]
MKKESKTSPEPEMLEEYDFDQGKRGKYAQRYADGTNIVLLSPDVARVFPDSESVNKALRRLVEIAQQSTKISS